MVSFNLQEALTNENGDLKRELVAFAKRLGFDSCRIAACAAPRHGNEFESWLREGGAGEMQWLERGAEKRCDPQKVLAGAHSVIVVALNYWQGAEAEPADSPNAPKAFGAPTAGVEAGVSPAINNNAAGTAATAPGATGKIARYAWGDDYHEVMLSKLNQLDELLRRHGGIQKCYVDTGPILERDHAAKAGIGWHGKSTMLIDRELGTWFFLGEILSTLELAPDPPQIDRCGSCERCITACPTGAITPHRLDARRCISYLTIELKGAIPLELRPLIGDRIYGCDDCLDACPWNRFAAVSRESAFAARRATTGMALREYLQLDNGQFRTLFRNSPIKRIKRRGFLRNICVALGNVGTRSDLPALKKAALDPEPLIAEHARWAITRIQERIPSEE